LIVQHFDQNQSILIVVESGNNGGDGLALSRLLKERGYCVLVYYIHGIEHCSDAFLEQYRLAVEKEVQIVEELPADEVFDVVVDAIFGIGLHRMVRGVHAKVIDWMNRMRAVRIAVDIPSGLHATSGAVLGTCVKADITVTFGYRKLGLVLYPGKDMAGTVKVADIGFPEEALWHSKPNLVTFGRGRSAVRQAFAFYPRRSNYSNKGTYANVLMVVGSKGMAGAAVIAAQSAYRMGCGLVRILTHETNRAILQLKVPEAIVLTYQNLQEAYNLLDANWDWADAVLIGSGIGLGDRAVGLTRAVVTYASERKGSMPVVVDGDALTILSEHAEIWNRYCKLPDTMRSYLTLTPHVKEMSRLCGDSVSEIAKDLIGSAERWIKKLRMAGRITVVLKDARTVVTNGKSLTYLNMTGNHGMATAGSGDCLAGMMVSVLAQIHKHPLHLEDKAKADPKHKVLPSFDNDYMAGASMAVCLHGRAGDMAKKRVGTVGMMALDIVDALPQVTVEYDSICTATP
jgi:NAD(P)H-hydrate epimerase